MRTSTIGVMKPTAYLMRLAPMRKPALSESDAIAAVNPSCGACPRRRRAPVNLLPRGLVPHQPGRCSVLKASVYSSTGKKLRQTYHHLGGAWPFFALFRGALCQTSGRSGKSDEGSVSPPDPGRRAGVDPH